MSDERPDIPRDDYRVPPKVKAKKRNTIKKVVDKRVEYAFVKANLAYHGILNPDGSFRKW